uniref:Homing endonuclease LAGLIDADG domain-containing protein n=1 Tax=Lobophyllia corymbosa TaxID=214976 RepID=A1IM16_9CNID|nr:hypothetical protein [Lobophyllia corymbosa]
MCWDRCEYSGTPTLVVVTIHARYNQSAGNRSCKKVLPLTDCNKCPTFGLTGSSETVRKNSSLSVHCPQHFRPTTDKEFGYYLAGLIEGDGSIVVSKDKAYIFIFFHLKDVSTAYYIKKRLGFGSMVKQKNKKAINLTIVGRRGLLKVVALVNGKFRSKKIESLHKLIYYLNENIQVFPKDTSSVLINHWLAGFLDADGYFQVRIIYRERKFLYGVRLHLKVDQKTKDVLNLLHEVFGGYVGYREKQDTYYYQSTGLQHALKVIRYLDRYHVLSKWLEYRQWRRVYLLIQEGGHKMEVGVEKIEKIKKMMENMRQSEH